MKNEEFEKDIPTINDKKIVRDNPNSTQSDINDSQISSTFWDKIPKYKWWVTPLNILFLCIFLVIIDVATLPNTAILHIDWAWWPICGVIFLYVISFILLKRPEIAWIIGPILMVGISLLLFAIDFIFPPNSGFLKLDWAPIPIAALLTFGVFIPIFTKFGRKKQKPIDRFRKVITMEKEQLNNESEKSLKKKIRD